MVRNANRFVDVSSSSTPSAANGYLQYSYTTSTLLDYSKVLGSISPLTLSPPVVQHQQYSPVYREESTRVQLQRQRLREQHESALVSSKIPGLKTSAAFFASLRTNLRLNASPPPSPMSTPPSMRASAASLPPPSPLAAPADVAAEASTTDDPLAGVPELSSYQARSQDDKIVALKLVADSIAQMRQTANSILIWHPANIAALIGVVSFFAQILTQYFDKDWLAVSMTSLALLMAYFAATRIFSQGYIRAAESLNWEWLEDADVFVTKFGEEIIGAVMVDWVSGESRKKSKKAWRGEVKGWAVKMRYRGKGVGTALLEEVVREAKSKGAESVEFSEDHAASIPVLPSFYNKAFDTREAKGKAHLQEIFESSSGRSKRR